MVKNYIPLLIACILIQSTLSVVLEGVNLNEMNRLSGQVLSLDGKYIIFSKKVWRYSTGKSSTNLHYTDIATGETKDLTPAIDGQSDTSPVFSTAFPNHIIFSRSNSEVSSVLFYMPFPPQEGVEPTQLTNYVLTMVDFKLRSNTLVFSTDVYFNCTTMQCSADLIKKEETATFQTYDNLMAFHWDKWLVQGKGTHLFMQKLKLSEDGSKIELQGEARDITYGMEINAPPLFTDNTNYDISYDGSMVTFSGHYRGHTETFITSWRTFFIDLNEMDKPILISGHNPAKTMTPVFNKDGTKVAYLGMKTPILESEFLHFEIYNILTNKVDIIDDSEFDLSVTEYTWMNDNLILLMTVDKGVNTLYTLDISDVTKPVYTLYPVKDPLLSYSVPITALRNNKVLVTKKVGYNYPDRLIILNDDEKEIVYLNKEFVDSIELPQHERISFTGGFNETVYGWLFKPINFVEGNKYKVVLLIHGGPESSWTSGWSYTWNPQIYTNQGYAVIMINPHGSSGVSRSFQNAVRHAWGGVPYEDIMTGVQYVIDTYPWIDGDHMCAAGGSYGGFMINWIEGNTDKFKCLINHDGLFSTIPMYYSTDEVWFPMAEFCPQDKIGCRPYESKEIREGFERYSPERFVQNWKTPMLVIHGGLDYRLSLTEALSTFTALQLKKVKSKFLFFPLENHWVLRLENQIKWFEAVLDFIKENIG